MIGAAISSATRPSAPQAIFSPSTCRNSVPAPAPSRATVRTVTGPSPMSISVSTIVASAIANENLPYSDAGSHRPAIIVSATSSTALPAVTVA